tara:strand:+ start:3925 stop:5646 length:1722 start_codon:yes stop_codon:yes gene_type:complete
MIGKIINFKDYLNFFEKVDQKYFYIIISLTIFTVFLETLSIGLIIPILQIILSDDIAEKYLNFINSGETSLINKDNLLIFSLLLLIFIYTLKAIFLTFFSYIENKLLSKIKVNLSKKLFSIYLNNSYLFHLKVNSSELTRNLLDLKRISAILTASSTFLTEILVLICVVSLLFYFEPIGTLGIFGVFTLFGFIFYFKIQRNAKEWGSIRKDMQAKIIENINNCFRSIKEIKIFNKEFFFIKDFTENSQKEIDAELNKQAFINSLPRYWFEWVTVVGMIILLIILYYLNNYSVDKIIPIIGLFSAAAFRLVPSIVRIMQTLQKIKFNLPVVEGVLDEINKEKFNLSNNYLNSKKKLLLNNFNKIQFNNINFKYDKKNENIINDISFSIKKNQILGINGKSGSGKTTILNIISGLLKINSGEILIDDKLLKNNEEFLQSEIGYVPQRIYLLDDTIKNNIAFGEKNSFIDDNKIFELVKNVQLIDLIKDSDKGLETNIGEFGDKLSGGQIQRIGLARALYLSPKILILDESTNALDEETESKIFNYLLKIKTEVAIIIVSHKKSILQNCDTVLNLK